MDIKKAKENDIEIAIVNGNEILIKDVQSALDLITTVKYETDCDRIIINKAAVCEEFFHLSTRLAGEILQKFINYNIKLAIIGDFSFYSESLKAFIFECNRGNNIYFLSDEKQAIMKLSIAL